MKGKRRRLSIKQKIIIILCLLLILIFSALLFIQSNINPIIISISEAQVKSLATTAINDAIFSCMDEELKYSDLITVTLDSNGKVTMIQANTMRINEIARNVSKKSELNIKNMTDIGITVPIGTLTGSPMLAGQGFDVKIQIMPIGSVICKFISEFEEAGINQTRHKIYLEITTSINLVIPVSTASMQIRNQVLISESILIGDVPQTYLDFGGMNELIDLVPN